MGRQSSSAGMSLAHDIYGMAHTNTTQLLKQVYNQTSEEKSSKKHFFGSGVYNTLYCFSIKDTSALHVAMLAS